MRKNPISKKLKAPLTVRWDIDVAEDIILTKKWMERKTGAEVSYSSAMREIIRLASENHAEFSSQLMNRGRVIDPQQTKLPFFKKEETQ